MPDPHEVSSPAGNQSEGPLAGVRVIEMGQLIAGPFCAQLLGDLGADVIKIEDPKKGDPMRQWGQAQVEGDSYWWSVLGRNKRSVTLDLRTPEGQEIARDLLSSADVAIENFRPGSLERWGLDFDSVSQTNPRLIMARISGFGQTGPYSSRPGYASVGEAMGGLRYLIGEPDRPPARTGISLGDSLTGIFAAMGVMAALYERERSGRGQVIDASIYESVLSVMESTVPDWSLGGVQRERTGGVLPRIAPSNVYPTKDGAWLVIAANQDTVFKRLADAMDQPELAEDERYATHLARADNQTELDELIGRFSSELSADELIERMSEHGVPVGRIFRVEDMLKDPHYKARNSIIDVPEENHGTVQMQNAFPRLSRTDSSVRWPGAPLGKHTDEVLTSLGYEADKITALRDQGVIR